MATQFNSILRLRRDNEYNYEKIKNKFIPLDGEVVLVDTSAKGLRAKVGDGKTLYKDLPFVGINENISVVSGYFIDDNFYENMEQTIVIEKQESKIYIDKPSSKIYIFNGLNYVPLQGQVPTASATISGTVKLYQSTGQNIDGTMSQKAITDELKQRYKTSVEDNQELLILSMN